MSGDIEEECRVDITHDSIDHSRLIVHSQQVEGTHTRKMNSEAK